MDSVTQVDAPLRGGKKMKKRKELDALVAHAIKKRCVDIKRSSLSGINNHDQLMSDSTDEQDYWTSSTGGRPARRRRRRYTYEPSTCAIILKLCWGMLVFCCLVLTLMAVWFFVDLREQVAYLRTEVNQVVAGSKGVPDALQKCHSLSKDLQKNQSQIMERLNGFSLLLNNFTSELAEVKSGLHIVQNQLKSSPDLINNPTIVKDLSTSVASFGSQIKDQGATILTLRDQYLKLDSLVNNLLTNITGITELLNMNKEKTALMEKNFAAEKESILAAISQMSVNVTSVNNTLSTKLQGAMDDRAKDHILIQNVKDMYANVTTRVTYLEGLCAKETKHSSGFLSVRQDSKPAPEIISQGPSFPSAQQLSLYSDPSGEEMSKLLENPT